MMIEKFIKKFVRTRKTVVFEDPYRTVPVSKVFGFDRGTPIDRYYIDLFLKEHVFDIKGRVLEIADRHYSTRFGSSAIEKIEIFGTSSECPHATIVGDLADKNTLPFEIIDCFICTQTFNVIFDFEKAVVGAHHVLKPGGVLLATVAGLCQISRYDMDRWGDYWRFTTASVQRVFDKIFGEDVKIKSCGNVLAACALLQGVSVEDLPNKALLDENDPDYQVTITIVARKAYDA